MHNFLHHQRIDGCAAQEVWRWRPHNRIKKQLLQSRALQRTRLLKKFYETGKATRNTTPDAMFLCFSAHTPFAKILMIHLAHRWMMKWSKPLAGMLIRSGLLHRIMNYWLNNVLISHI